MTNISFISSLFKGMENSSSLGMFFRDTAGCLAAKLALSRSKNEAKEISFSELAESSIFYFSAPILAKLTSDIFSKKYNINKNLMTESVKNIKNLPDHNIKNIKLAKFGQITSTFSIILPIVFAIAPVRNILTQLNCGKEKFTSVVGLNNSKNDNAKKNAKENIKKTSAKTVLSSAILLTLSSALLKTAKNNKIYKFTQPLISGIVKNFEFSKSNDLKLSHYGALIYPVSIFSYFKASRDKYEKQENARRFAITVPLLFFGEKLIEKPIYNLSDKLFNTKIIENGIIKSYNEILKMPDVIKNQYLKSKNFAYGSAFFINTFAIASAVGILNRISTKTNFEKENKKNIIVC